MSLVNTNKYATASKVSKQMDMFQKIQNLKGGVLKLTFVGKDSGLGKRSFAKFRTPNDPFVAEALKRGYCYGLPNFISDKANHKIALDEINAILATEGYRPIQMPNIFPEEQKKTWTDTDDKYIKDRQHERAWQECKNKANFPRKWRDKCMTNRKNTFWDNFVNHMPGHCEKMTRLEQSALDNLAVEAESLKKKKVIDEIRKDANKPEVLPIASDNKNIILGIFMIALLGFLAYKFLIKR